MASRLRAPHSTDLSDISTLPDASTQRTHNLCVCVCVRLCLCPCMGCVCVCVRLRPFALAILIALHYLLAPKMKGAVDRRDLSWIFLPLPSPPLLPFQRCFMSAPTYSPRTLRLDPLRGSPGEIVDLGFRDHKLLFCRI